MIIGFAAIALLRSSDTSTLVAGNLAFQKTALAAGDAGTEAAITWLTANGGGTTLFDDDAANGYYATTADACDLTGTRTPDDDDGRRQLDRRRPRRRLQHGCAHGRARRRRRTGYTVRYVSTASATPPATRTRCSGRTA